MEASKEEMQETMNSDVTICGRLECTCSQLMTMLANAKTPHWFAYKNFTQSDGPVSQSHAHHISTSPSIYVVFYESLLLYFECIRTWPRAPKEKKQSNAHSWERGNRKLCIPTYSSSGSKHALLVIIVCTDFTLRPNSNIL